MFDSLSLLTVLQEAFVNVLCILYSTPKITLAQTDRLCLGTMVLRRPHVIVRARHHLPPSNSELISLIGTGREKVVEHFVSC